MKLVILGAGASFDSVYDFYDNAEEMPWRPPLGNELFDTRESFRNIILSYPGGRYFISQLNAIADIELFFEEKWRFIENNRAQDLLSAYLNLNYCLSHLMLQISTQYKHVGLSNYDILVQKAYEYCVKTKEEVILVSFNYDLLLEYSISKLFFGVERELTINEYISLPIKIIKPHGSCNWFKRFNNNIKPNEGINIHDYLFQNKFSLKQINQSLEPDIRTISSPTNSMDFGKPNERWFCFPQILLPLKEKDEFILPQAHDGYLRNNLRKVDEILTIGWKGSEYHFQELLKRNLQTKNIRITSVNVKDKANEEIFKKYLPKSEFYHYELSAFLQKQNNTLIKESHENKARVIHHAYGTFSSYMLNTVNGTVPNFFNIH